MREFLRTLTKDELIDLLEMSSKNIVAMDGVWFQAIEKAYGMDKAMEYDQQVWSGYSPAEAARLKKYFKMEEHPGLEGLQKCLTFGYNTLSNEVEFVWDGDALIYRVNVCRVQTARARKGMPYHPCKPVGLTEYSGFASAVDDRIVTECLSCYPEVTDETCGCAWRFTIPQD